MNGSRTGKRDEAIRLIPLLDRAAGGLEYVEQPCASVEDLAAVRRRVDVPIAADESIRRAEDPYYLTSQTLRVITEPGSVMP